MLPNEELQRTLEADGYITVAKAAGMLKGVRRSAIYAWVEAGDVAHRRVGKRRMFVRETDVRRMLGLAAAKGET